LTELSKFCQPYKDVTIKNFVGKSIESIADNILVEKIGNKIRFIYGESKLGKGIITDNQEMLMEMIKTGAKVEVRSERGIGNFVKQGRELEFDQINIFRGQNVTDVLQPIIKWSK